MARARPPAVLELNDVRPRCMRERELCDRALEVRHRGAREQLLRDSGALLARALAPTCLALLSAVAWGGELALADNQLIRLGDSRSSGHVDAGP